jgi:2-polyprenyl-6-methoxyphenol hydroxylase-like FAD-dependent oxidoreductase
MNHNRFHVLIIGGGSADPARSLFLKNAGISSTVYEAYPYTEGVGAGFNLAPNGMNVLNALGFAEKVKARGCVALENCFRSEAGRALARYDNGSKTYGQPAVSLLRTDLYEILAEGMTRRGIAVEYEKRLTVVACSSDHTYVNAGAFIHQVTNKHERFLVIGLGRSPIIGTRGTKGAHDHDEWRHRDDGHGGGASQPSW